MENFFKVIVKNIVKIHTVSLVNYISFSRLRTVRATLNSYYISNSL